MAKMIPKQVFDTVTLRDGNKVSGPQLPTTLPAQLRLISDSMIDASSHLWDWQNI